MLRRNELVVIAGFAILVWLAPLSLRSAEPPPQRLRAVLLGREDVSESRLARLKDAGFNAVVLAVDDGPEEHSAADRMSAERVRTANLDLYFWIEVARHAPTADAHPLRMASLQGHGEWRRLFPKTPETKKGEIAKTYPWTPILYRENFDDHLARITKLIESRPPSKGVFVNDLQAAPSACGCGNLVCRWTTDYGPIETAERLGEDAAARFVAELARRCPGREVIPVWTPECEEHDKDTLCAGIGCYQGLCWKRYAAQLEPLAKQANQIAMLCLYKEFGQRSPHWKTEAGWVEHVLRTCEKPPQNGPKISSSRLIAVLQGWNVTPQELAAQIARSEAAGVARIVVAEKRVEQGWEPRVVRLIDRK